MTERKPPEGIYLDAVLGVLGERIDERIDQHERRRARRVRLGAVAASIALLVGGSAGAYALGGLTAEAPEQLAAAPGVTATLSCFAVSNAGAGESADPFFAVRYAVHSEAEVPDAVALCAAASGALAADAPALRAASPRELIEVATALFSATSDELAEGETNSAAEPPQVQSASFGVDPLRGGVPLRCGSTLDRWVVYTPEAAESPATTCASVGVRP